MNEANKEIMEHKLIYKKIVAINNIHRRRECWDKAAISYGWERIMKDKCLNCGDERGSHYNYGRCYNQKTIFKDPDEFKILAYEAIKNAAKDKK